MALKKDFSKVEYRIKLLSGNNVVLVEANGFESEIFVPEIQNGRISFQNIVPNRRCCFKGTAQTIKGLMRRKRRSVQSTTEQRSTNATTERTRASISPSQTWRLQGGGGLNDIHHTHSPLAFSTPASAPSPTLSYLKKSQMKYNKENYELQQPRTSAQAYHTIELLQPKSTSLLQQQQQMKINSQNLNTPLTKTARIQCVQADIDKVMRDNAGGGAVDFGDSGRDFNVPDVPSLTPRPLQNSTQTNKNKMTPGQVEAPDTVTKWRKCITPIRTYSRHALNVPALRANASVKKVRQKTKSLSSATQGTKGTYKVELKRRKLIFDTKTAISPRTFKKQQNSTTPLRRRSVERERIAASLPKESKRYDTSKHTAFDMLTTPSRSHVMANKLQQQFRKACVNKASSTCPKYKLLCKLPPLEEPSKIKVNMLTHSPSNNTTVAAMLEKARSNAIRKCVHSMNAKVMRWPIQQQPYHHDNLY
ncbi:uncharacterized protein uno [Eurosta solidaginis]|uniref:uncharacterized protein uno n=1 Tax=Eurosta solidaginis TaxID=178769 RepID=UPI003530DEF9